MKFIAFITGFIIIAHPAWTQSSKMAEYASRFLATLDEPQKNKALFTFKDDERQNWHFVPRARQGVSFQDMRDHQREAALTLLKVSLSDQGYKKVTNIIELENVLRKLEGRGASDTYRDPLRYYFTIFGTPSPATIWGWRIEGHHVAFNFVSARGAIDAATPSFLGANPATVPDGRERGKQVLKLETDLGFALLNSLSATQRHEAIIATEAPSEILSYNRKKATLLKPDGIKFTSLNAQQQDLFMQLLTTYTSNYEMGFAHKLLAKIKKAGVENMTFAWAGSLTPGAPHYYRIQGPVLLIEYDNTQNNANHIHSTVRDLTNDFGEDILREHYEKEHGKNK